MEFRNRYLASIQAPVNQNQRSLEEFYKEYLKYAEINFSAKYTVSIRLAFKHLLQNLPDDKILNEVTIKDADNFISVLSISAPKGVSVYLRTLKAAFNKAKEWEYIHKNPFEKVKVQKTMRVEPDFVTETQLETILIKIKNRIIKKIVEVAFLTGARLDEVVSLRINNIDFVRDLIKIGDENFTTKSRKQRYVPISYRLKQIFLELNILSGAPEAFIFRKDNGFRFTGEHVSKQFKKACREAGMRETIHFHSLRHSFGTILGQKGVPMITVKELMGHSSIVTTQIYSHASLDDMRKAVNLFNETNQEASKSNVN